MVSCVAGMMMHAHTINADVANLRNRPYTTSTHPIRRCHSPQSCPAQGGQLVL